MANVTISNISQFTTSTLTSNVGRALVPMSDSPTGNVGSWTTGTASLSTIKSFLANFVPTGDRFSFSTNANINTDDSIFSRSVYSLEYYIGNEDEGQIANISNLTISGTPATSGSYTVSNLSASDSSGEGAEFIITSNGTAYTISNIVYPGRGFDVGDTITVSGTLLGGNSASNATITINDITGPDPISVRFLNFESTFSAANARIGVNETSISTLQTQVFANANLAANLANLTSEISSDSNITTTANLTVSNVIVTSDVDVTGNISANNISITSLLQLPAIDNATRNALDASVGQVVYSTDDDTVQVFLANSTWGNLALV
jgi:hypothetical protein